MIFRVLIVVLFLIPIQLSAQSLAIKNGDQEKVFSADSYYSLVFTDGVGGCCYAHVDGSIQRITADSLKIKVHDFKLDNRDLDFLLKVYPNENYEDYVLTFPRSDIQLMQVYKSKKSFEKKNNWLSLGIVTAVTGLVTLANVYDFGNKNVRSKLLVSSGVQLGASVLFFSLASKKKYRAEDGWQF